MDKLFRLLKELGLAHLIKGFMKSPAAARRAVIRIQKGESPHRVLTEESGISVKPRDIEIRALKQGYGYPRDEVYHASWSDIDAFRPVAHFGSKKAAHDVLKGGSFGDFQRPVQHKGAIYPVRLSEKRGADWTVDITEPDEPLVLGDFLAKVEPSVLRKYLDTLKYTNKYEDEGALSFINTKPNVRGRYAMHNPNWIKFRDLLAGTGALSLLPFGNEEP